MKFASDRETVVRLTTINRDKESEVNRLTENFCLNERSLEQHQANELIALRNEIIAGSADSIKKLETDVDA
eukprot:13979525-Heterocapsa_arctica.AAC.1